MEGAAGCDGGPGQAGGHVRRRRGGRRRRGSFGLFLRRAEGAGVGLGEGGVGGRGAILIERRGQQAWSEEDMDMGSEVGHGRGDWDGRDPRGS